MTKEEIRDLAQKQKEDFELKFNKSYERISDKQRLELLEDIAKVKDKETKETVVFLAKLFVLGLAVFSIVMAGVAITAWVVATIVKYVLF
ncbi:MAG: hypothetical protein FD167_1599 [bacterium]|nr:MAG: hypothetical protein FD167_1599 [bacterium]